ncbi:MAG: hypothetical protein R3A48_14720 [Polyangiales bacterium]
MSSSVVAWGSRVGGRALLAGLLLGAVVGCRPSGAASNRCETARISARGIPLSRCPVPTLTLDLGCGPGCRQVTRVGTISPDPALSCVTRRAFWWVADSHLLRAGLPGGEVTSVLGSFRGEHAVDPTGVACDGDDVVFTASTRERDAERVDLVARFRDGGDRAEVVWRDAALRSEQPAPLWPAVSGELVAWSWDFTVPTLWAQRGRAAPVSVRADVHATTPPAAWSGGLFFHSGTRIERWSPSYPSPGALSPAVGDQWSPVAHGRFVAWMDQRDEPRGTSRAPRNPQVYLLPVAGGRAVRASAGARVGWRGQPSLSDEWLVWVDTRNDPVPDRQPGAWMRAEVYGWRLPAGPEVRLAADVVASLPRVVGGALYYVGASEGTRRDLFTRPMPR